MHTFAIFAALLSVVAGADAAVVYTVGKGFLGEYEPSKGYVRNVDVDGDGQRDFYFADTGGGNGMTLVPLGANQLLATREVPPDLGRNILEVTRGDDIGASPGLGAFIGAEEGDGGIYDEGGSFIYYCNGRGPVGVPPQCIFSFNPWDEDGVSYFGFRVWKNNLPRYGWVAVSLPIYGPNHDIYINGWAYETEVGQRIIAGAIPEPSTLLLAWVSFAACLFLRPLR